MTAPARALLVVGLLAATVPVATESVVNRPVVGRSHVLTRYGMVATSQPLAARAGVQVLERGGTAVDAAIAANAVMGLMEPTGSGLGGDLFALIYQADTGTLYGLNASGWAATGLTPELLRSRGITTMPQRGPFSVTVPGVVAGWAALHDRFAKLPLEDLLAPAIFYAEEGVPITEVVAAGWARSVKMLAATPIGSPTPFSSTGARHGPARSSAIPTWRDPCGSLVSRGAMACIAVRPQRPSWRRFALSATR